jgi:UDP:flavonoid glycosyltransferase YjiC (YdhE family)
MKRLHAGSGIATRDGAKASARLTSLANWSELLVTGQLYQEVAANVAEYYDIQLATLDYIPLRVNRQLIPGLPSSLSHSAMTAVWWAYWRMTKQSDDAQRAEFGLPKTTGHIPHVDHVKIVSDVNRAAIFPTCSAVVHEGGAGTTAADLLDTRVQA